MLRRLLVLFTLLGLGKGFGQDLQPRRWGHLPLDTNVVGVVYGYTSADISFSPSLRIEEGELDMHSAVFSYVRSFEFLGKSARFDLVQAYQDGRWKGVLDGTNASTSRTGFSDTTLRFSMNLIGGPPLSGAEFAGYRTEVKDCETIVGLGLTVVLPTGHYLKDRLLNLGSNRFTIRPQLGLVHSRGPWSFELTGGIWFFTDNNSFFNGKSLEQDPLLTLQGHLVYTFRPGFWFAAGSAFGIDGQTTVNGRRNDDYRNNFVWGTSLGFSVSRQLGFRLSYINMHSLERSGFDSDTVLFGATLVW